MGSAHRLGLHDGSPLGFERVVWLDGRWLTAKKGLEGFELPLLSAEVFR